MWQGERPDVLASLQTSSWTGTHWSVGGLWTVPASSPVGQGHLLAAYSCGNQT
jgi:hypothetical protein